MSIQTVFVIGAGANQEIGMPTGEDLKQIIYRKLDIQPLEYGEPSRKDCVVVDALKYILHCKPGKHDLGSYLNAARNVSSGVRRAISIDNYIDSQGGDEKIDLCAKLAISQSILEYERKSSLYVKNGEMLSPGKISGTWYESFWHRVTENCDASDLEERFRQIGLVIFNYDRCVQWFLYQYLKNHYKQLSLDQVIHLVGSIQIYHPYGNLGDLKFHDHGCGIKFGASIKNETLLESIQRIKTFAEADGIEANSNEISEIRRVIGEAERLIFLGCGFHQINNKLIKPNKNIQQPKQKEVFATAYGRSNYDQRKIKKEMTGLFGSFKSFEIENITCSKFFKEYSKGLSFV